jgi:hypothetical protein
MRPVIAKATSGITAPRSSLRTRRGRLALISR